MPQHHRLDQIAQDWLQGLIGVNVGFVTGKEQQLTDGNLDTRRIKPLRPPGDPLLKILRRRFGTGKLQRQLLTPQPHCIRLAEDAKACPGWGTMGELLAAASLARLNTPEAENLPEDRGPFDLRLTLAAPHTGSSRGGKAMRKRLVGIEC